jgi:hypothetical protein
MKIVLRELNSTLFTENGIPLPVEDDESLLYYNAKTKFIVQTGDGTLASTRKFVSYSGTIYLTNYRLVYRPEKPARHFESFGVPISKLFYPETGYSVDYLVDMNSMATIYISFEDSQSNVFFAVLGNLLDKTSFGIDLINENRAPEELPYYTDMCDEPQSASGKG